MLDLAVLLFFLGLLLVAVEIFVPSMGLLSLMAGASFVALIATHPVLEGKNRRARGLVLMAEEYLKQHEPEAN